ncbi:uncharacterized protein METZ01_LOCUS432425, partial [marine metagenome]
VTTRWRWSRRAAAGMTMLISSFGWLKTLSSKAFAKTSPRFRIRLTISAAPLRRSSASLPRRFVQPSSSAEPAGTVPIRHPGTSGF